MSTGSTEAPASIVRAHKDKKKNLIDVWKQKENEPIIMG